MPTQKARHMITESDELARSLDAAETLWPDCKSRTDLLRLIIEEGAQVLQARVSNLQKQRMEALKDLQKLGTGLWPADFDEQRKSEWDD